MVRKGGVTMATGSSVYKRGDGCVCVCVCVHSEIGSCFSGYGSQSSVQCVVMN